MDSFKEVFYSMLTSFERSRLLKMVGFTVELSDSFWKFYVEEFEKRLSDLEKLTYINASKLIIVRTAIDSEILTNQELKEFMASPEGLREINEVCNFSGILMKSDKRSQVILNDAILKHLSLIDS